MQSHNGKSKSKQRQPQAAVTIKTTTKNRSKNAVTIARLFLSRLFARNTPKPYYNENTFFVWEPCSKSHAEVVPGFCKLLLDAGYDVSVLIEPKRIEEGLFYKFYLVRLDII